MSKTKQAYRKEVELEVNGQKKTLVLTAPPFDASKFKTAKFPKSVTRELLISLVTDVREQGYAN